MTNEIFEIISRLSIKNKVYIYDDKGNQILEQNTEAGTSTEMEYTVTGEMTELTEYSGETATMTQNNLYEHNGIRFMKTEDGASRDYYYDSGACAFTMDGSNVSTVNILTPQGSVAGSYRDSTYNTYLKDQQGSTTNIVNENGTFSAAYDYSDFGETTEITESGFDNQVCYTGGIYDDETELYYLNARYYDPELGRFISQDTYRGTPEESDQWHLYAYCAKNPINYVDPSGHWRSTKTNHFRSNTSNKVIFQVKFVVKWQSKSNNKLIKAGSVKFDNSNVVYKNNPHPKWIYQKTNASISVARNGKSATITNTLRAKNSYYGITINHNLRVVLKPNGVANWSTGKVNITITVNLVKMIMTFY